MNNSIASQLMRALDEFPRTISAMRTGGRVDGAYDRCYRALRRLEAAGFVASEIDPSCKKGYLRNCYTITPLGMALRARYIRGAP